MNKKTINQEHVKELTRLLTEVRDAALKLNDFEKAEDQYVKNLNELNRVFSKMNYIENIIKTEHREMMEEFNNSGHNPYTSFMNLFKIKSSIDLKSFFIIRKCLIKIDNLSFIAFKILGELVSCREKLMSLGVDIKHKDHREKFMIVIDHYKSLISKSQEILDMAPSVTDMIHYRNEDRFFNCIECKKDISKEDIYDTCWDCKLKDSNLENL